MSTRAEDRPGRSHVPPTPPAKLAPADDPAWAHTLALAALAREARPTTTNEETTMADTPAKGLEWIADRLDQLNANAVTMFEDIDERAGNGGDIDSDTDELRHQSIGASIAYGTAAQMVRETLAPPTNKDDTRTLEWNGVTVTIGTSSGRDGAALVIIDTEGEPDGSDGWKGLRVDVNDGQVFEGVPLVLAETSARRYETERPTACRIGSTDPRSVTVVDSGYAESYCPVHGTQPNPLSPCGFADIVEHHVSSMKEDGAPLADGRYRVRFGDKFTSEADQVIFEPAPTFPTDGSMETAP